MKTLLRYLSLALFTATLLSADTTETNPTGITELVSKIKSAKPEDKRVLINQLKVKLRVMNKETRKQTMMHLRKSFTKKGMHQPNHTRHPHMMQQEKAHTTQQAGERGAHQGMSNGGSFRKGHQ